MAFTFVVETGTGLVATANSYVTVAEADDIIITNIHANTAWTALTTAQKEYLLAWSSRYLDERTTWKGYKTVSTSPMRWPRTGVCDRDNVLIGSTTIPQQLKVATAEMARYLIAQDRTVERDTDGLKAVKADVVELEFLEGYTLPQVPSNMKYLIQGLGFISTGAVTFAPIRR